MQLLWKSLELKKLHVELLYGLASPASRYMPKITENKELNRYYSPIIQVALFTITKRWKQPKRSLKDEMLDKDGINMQRNIIQPLKRKGNSYTCCNMDEH